MDIPAKRRRHPLGHEQRSLTGSIFSRYPGSRTSDLWGSETAPASLTRPLQALLPVTRDGGAFGYVAVEGPLQLAGAPNLRPRRRWGDRAPRAGRPPPPCVRGHREAARHLRQAGLRVVGHVITLREFGLFEADTSSLCRRLPAIGHFITADRKNSDFLDFITYSQIRAEAEARGRERARRS